MKPLRLSFPHFRIVSSSLVENRFPRASRSRSSFFRFRRDVSEGTFEDMILDDDSDGLEGRNITVSERVRRQSGFPGVDDDKTDKTRADVCESEVEVETPYWAVNSEGKLRAILNNKEFEQSVHKVDNILCWSKKQKSLYE